MKYIVENVILCNTEPENEVYVFSSTMKFRSTIFVFIGFVQIFLKN